MKTLKDNNWSGATTLIRVDYNVPITDGVVQNIERIKASIASIKYLIEHNINKIILISHLGQPKNNHDDFSLEPVTKVLEYLLKENIGFSETFSVTDKRITLLENIRFHEGEEKNDPNFAKLLANMADFYINDAFSCAHREHASIVGVPKFLPSFAGMSLMSEMQNLSLTDVFATRPVIAIVGGSKISTKLPMIENLVHLVDKLILGGALANTILKNRGYNIESSLHENINTTLDYDNVILPHDVVTSTNISNKNSHVCDVRWIPKDEMILDVGPASAIRIKQILDSAKTVLWNGPLGAFEFPPFDNYSIEIGSYISNLSKADRIKSIIGGGDTLAVSAKIEDASFGYVSTAGGAYLKWLEGKSLPGIDAIS